MKEERRDALINQVDLIKSMDSVIATNYLNDQYILQFKRGLRKAWNLRSQINKSCKRLSYELIKESFDKVMSVDHKLEDTTAEDIMVVLELVFNETYKLKGALRKEDLTELIRDSDIIAKIKQSNIN